MCHATVSSHLTTVCVCLRCVMSGLLLQASQIYPTTTDSYVRSHQLWAACTLFQATGEDKYWEDATTIYTTFIQPERDDAEELPTEMEPYQLFDPVANFYNPVWWGMLCMAQSAPEYSGLEEEANLLVPRQVAGGAEDDEFIAFLLDQEFKRATRGEAAQQIWKQFVLPWITFDGALKENTPQNVRITCAAFLTICSSRGPRKRFQKLRSPQIHGSEVAILFISPPWEAQEIRRVDFEMCSPTESISVRITEYMYVLQAVTGRQLPVL